MKFRTQPQHLAVTGALILALLILILVSAADPIRADEEVEDFETGEVVVKLEPASGATIEDINADYGSTTLEKLLGSANIFLLKLPASSDTESVAEQMEGDPRLIYAEPNFVAETPEGNLRHKARGLSGAKSSSTRYSYDALNLSCAHRISRGSGTTVAVLDTGAQLDHPALKANFEGIKRYDFIDDDTVPADKGNGKDDDGNGHVDEMVGHGTHVTGVVDLVAPAARIMPLRVLDTEGYGNVFIIAEAVSYAERHGVDVVNLSLSTPGHSDLLQDVIEDTTESGIVVVAAAGNDNSAMPQYPAAGDGETADDGLLAVTAVDRHEKKSSFANYGSWVDITAPGNGIRSTFPESKYAAWSGTSMATPFVAGQAALIQSVAGTLDAAGVETQIRDTARLLDAKNPAYAGMLGAGHADAGASLKQYGSCS